MIFKSISIAAGAFALFAVATPAQAGDHAHSYNDGYDNYRTQQVGGGVGYDRYVHHRTRVGVELSVGANHHYERPGYRDSYRTAPHRQVRHPRKHRYVADPYANRTEFCRFEYRIKAYSGRKVKVKRCIHVRNDLLGVYLADGWSRH